MASQLPHEKGGLKTLELVSLILRTSLVEKAFSLPYCEKPLPQKHCPGKYKLLHQKTGGGPLG